MHNQGKSSQFLQEIHDKCFVYMDTLQKTHGKEAGKRCQSMHPCI
ncbi:hypothetical protein MITSMUL_03021 [Mitsuokella multacida DSM 20544]|uniref:Uncharacterized protein n=1 Tax=Mitsuokella multacida DSM 20544 TaxID=500635 RepID=C9KJ24_9FIRM|nr:hypothetical protein MITSMUL_03021 [Mitsuokella multacida DSM 20544]